VHYSKEIVIFVLLIRLPVVFHCSRTTFRTPKREVRTPWRMNYCATAEKRVGQVPSCISEPNPEQDGVFLFPALPFVPHGRAKMGISSLAAWKTKEEEEKKLDRGQGQSLFFSRENVQDATFHRPDKLRRLRKGIGQRVEFMQHHVCRFAMRLIRDGRGSLWRSGTEMICGW
jgi:hypothetical protein